MLTSTNVNLPRKGVSGGSQDQGRLDETKPLKDNGSFLEKGIENVPEDEERREHSRGDTENRTPLTTNEGGDTRIGMRGGYQRVDSDKNLERGTQELPRQDREADRHVADPGKTQITILNHFVSNKFSLAQQAYFWSRRKCLSRPKTKGDELVSFPTKVDKDKEHLLGDNVLSVTVLDSHTLELNPDLLHPFVKMHVVDMNTGHYVTKTDINAPGVTQFESLTQVSSDKTVESAGCNFILPFATPPDDMRVKGLPRPEWNEEFIINHKCSDLFNSEVVILFELLDFNVRLMREKPKKLDQHGLYKIAWGYLRLKGQSGTHLGVKKIQLNRYRYRTTKSKVVPPKERDTRTPEVYYDFDWPSHDPYPSYLRVRIDTVPAPRNYYNVERISLTPFEREVGKKSFEQMKREASKKTKLNREDPEESEKLERQKLLMKIRRLPYESCEVPKTFYHRFDSEALGCYRLKFSNNGRMLAAAVTEADSTTLIRIFNIEDCKLIRQYRAHNNIVHHLSWSQQDTYVVSSSADGTAKMWDVASRIADIALLRETTAEDNDALYVTFNHPSFVYGSCFYPEDNSSRFLVATACYDGKVRVWVTDKQMFRETFESGFHDRRTCEVAAELLVDETLVDKRKVLTNLVEHVHPNCLIFDNTGRLYVGDSQGVVHVWDIQTRGGKFSQVRMKSINDPEIAGCPINSIRLLRLDQRDLLVHTRDNSIRIYETISAHNEPWVRFTGLKCENYNITSCLSPDSCLLSSGSEDGKPYLWGVQEGALLPTSFWEVRFLDSICDVDWSVSYNMIAFSGFGKEYPIVLFVHEKQQEQLSTLNINDYKQPPTYEMYQEGVALNRQTAQMTTMGRQFEQRRQDNDQRLYHQELDQIRDRALTEGGEGR